VAIASLVIAVLGFVVAGVGVFIARRSLAESKRSADAAERSATAGDRSATAAESSAGSSIRSADAAERSAEVGDRSAGAAERSATSSDRSASAAERSAAAAEGTREAADAQAKATAAQASAARDQLAIERERFHREQTPVLEGIVKPRPSWRGGPPEMTHLMEVRVRSSQMVSTLLLHLPVDAYIARSQHLIGPGRQDFGYPEGRGSAPLGPTNPAIWDVAVGAESPGSFIAYADCRNEYGHEWTGVEVRFTREV
jgi:hypothetical protein